MERAWKIRPQALIKLLFESACTYSGLLLENRRILLGDKRVWTFDRFRAFEAIPIDLIDALGLPRIPPAGSQRLSLCVEPKNKLP